MRWLKKNVRIRTFAGFWPHQTGNVSSSWTYSRYGRWTPQKLNQFHIYNCLAYGFVQGHGGFLLTAGFPQPTSLQLGAVDQHGPKYDFVSTSDQKNISGPATNKWQPKKTARVHPKKWKNLKHHWILIEFTTHLMADYTTSNGMSKQTPCPGPRLVKAPNPQKMGQSLRPWP